MHYVTKQEADLANSKLNLRSVSVTKLTPIEEKVKDIVSVINLPANTAGEKKHKWDTVEKFIEEIRVLSNDNEVLIGRCQAAFTSKEKLEELLWNYPRVKGVLDRDTPLNVFAKMYRDDVSYHAFEATVEWILEIIGICKRLPAVSAFVHTPGSWPISVFREKAVAENNPAYYGVTIPAALDLRVQIMHSYYPVPMQVYQLDEVSLKELCRRVGKNAPEGVSFKKRKDSIGYRTIIDVIRDIEGKQVVNSFIMH